MFLLAIIKCETQLPANKDPCWAIVGWKLLHFTLVLHRGLGSDSGFLHVAFVFGRFGSFVAVLFFLPPL